MVFRFQVTAALGAANISAVLNLSCLLKGCNILANLGPHCCSHLICIEDFVHARTRHCCLLIGCSAVVHLIGSNCVLRFEVFRGLPNLHNQSQTLHLHLLNVTNLQVIPFGERRQTLHHRIANALVYFLAQIFYTEQKLAC